MIRYTVHMYYPGGFDFHEGAANDAIDAVLRCVKSNHMQPGGYAVTVEWRHGVSTGHVSVNADGSITIGARWDLPTPAERIPDDGTLPMGCPDV
jgi:hypothetical protein